jgi:hypothetical protein
MGKDAPQAPDPKETASAQTGTNIGTAIANGYIGNINQVTPDGSLTYKTTGTQKWTDPTSGKVYDIPTTTAIQSLSKTQQKLKNKNDVTQSNLANTAMQQSKRLGGLLNEPFSLDGLPAAGDASKLGLPQYQQFSGGPQLQTSVGDAGPIQRQIADAGQVQTGLADAGDITKSYNSDFSADRQKVEDALLSRINPQLSNDRAALEQKLANQGLMPGSEAFNRAVDESSRASNDARYGAILAGGQEQSRLVGLEAQRAQFQNSAQQQLYDQIMGKGTFANSAQQQQFGQNAAQMEANNSGQAQQYQQGLASAQFGNDANQQIFANNNQATAGNNSLQDQAFNAEQSKIAAQNSQRTQALNEAFAARNQPLNEISGLLSGSQITSPSFVPTQGQSIPTVDYAGLVNQDYQNRLGAYNTKQAGYGSLLGGLAGMFTL